ncbi:MAG: pyrimidine 5'-nucleotidase [Rhizobiaceae bacterium]|nr:pyrimidine 5'-nucleotidase [Rhizobiaceae bacterium]
MTDWVFDLDNTLYPGHCNLFVQVDKRITHYVMRVTSKDFDEARLWQKHYYREYGTTLRGLMDEHGVDPRHYMEDVHDIDYSAISPNPELGELITALPGRKHIFTNGDVSHAQRTLTALDIEGRFDKIFDIAHADFVPKPDRVPYDKFLRDHEIDPNFAVMFEDMPRNLEVPKILGMTTVLLVEGEGQESQRENWETEGKEASHIDYVSDDINSIIKQILQTI